MTGEEIREKINHNNDLIAKSLDPSIFTLNKMAKDLLDENEYLRSICPHKFENKICIYCGGMHE